jgi:tRNA nucleotidyltransferase (CCA-adding enzyme)
MWHEGVEEKFREVQAFDPPPEWRLNATPEDVSLCYGLWLINLPLDDAKSVCERLHFSSEDRIAMLEANQLAREFPSVCAKARPSRVVEMLDNLRETALLIVWLGLKAKPDCRQVLEKYFAEWRFVRPDSSGDTLRELNLPPGPAYRKILAALRSAWLDGQIRSREEEERLLLEYVEKAKRGETIASV